tara:strand:+ start:265 stop:393 length:129 start_codon:yes stop_codon:yes gene_type:complete
VEEVEVMAVLLLKQMVPQVVQVVEVVILDLVQAQVVQETHPL